MLTTTASPRRRLLLQTTAMLALLLLVGFHGPDALDGRAHTAAHEHSTAAPMATAEHGHVATAEHGEHARAPDRDDDRPRRRRLRRWPVRTDVLP